MDETLVKVGEDGFREPSGQSPEEAIRFNISGWTRRTNFLLYVHKDTPVLQKNGSSSNFPTKIEATPASDRLFYRTPGRQTRQD
jgi:hypothetical protein